MAIASSVLVLPLYTLCVIFLMSFSRLYAQNIQEVQSMNNHVLALLNRGEYTQAMPLGLKVLKLSEDSLGPESLRVRPCRTLLRSWRGGWKAGATTFPNLCHGQVRKCNNSTNPRVRP